MKGKKNLRPVERGTKYIFIYIYKYFGHVNHIISDNTVRKQRGIKKVKIDSKVCKNINFQRIKKMHLD